MRARVLAVAALTAAVSLAVAPFAAADTLVQFSTTSSGTRVLTTAVAPTFPVTQDLTTSQTVATTVPASELVTEVLATGSAWSVKAQMCGPNDPATPTAAACATKPNEMERSDGTATITGSRIAVTHGTPVKTLGGGTLTAGSEANMAGQITLLNNTGQSPLTAYSGTYAGTTNLSISNMTETGTWKGYWVVTTTF